MKRIRTFLAGAVAALGLTLTGPAGAVVQGTLTKQIVDLNNPCTIGHDSIDGVLDINYTIDRSANGSPRLLLSARGSGSDASNLFYRFTAAGTFIFTDPLPAQITLSVRLQPSNTPMSDARLGLFLLIDERGRVTDLGQSGLQCGSPG
ncbi:MAG: hypothetical protein K0Q68_2597 [Moraxellaceae bacterium]|jgi:hypothetical protein|nr:hypothetical protein [Moraxellaceae bacterium]